MLVADFFSLAVALIAALVDTTDGQKLNMTAPMPPFLMAKRSTSSARKTKISLIASINYGGPSLPTGPVCTEAMQIALDAVAKSPLLERYELVIEPFDDMCSRPVGVRQIIDAVSGNFAPTNDSSNRLPLVLGPLCAAQLYDGTFVQHYNHVELAAASNIIEIFTKRSLYSSFYVLNPSTETFYEAVPSFLKRNGWSNVFLLTESLVNWNPLEEILSSHLSKLNISLVGTSKVLTIVGQVPSQEQFETAVSNLAELNPRVIIIDTSYGAQVSCLLHRYKLFGPDYVLIIMGVTYFLPNAMRPPGCTEQMLFEVLESVIWFTFNSPINVDSNAADLLGTRAGDFDATMKSRLQDPELSSLWFFWRSLCYDQVAAAAITLNNVELELQKANDTLSNWFTSGERFSNNGSYIYSAITNKLNQLAYKGLSTAENTKPNSRVGSTGFFQMQTVDQPSLNGPMPLSAKLRPVPVASYNSADPSWPFKNGPGSYVWRTPDGKPPFDSLHVVETREATIGKVAEISIKAFAATILLANLAFLFANLYATNAAIARSMPVANSMVSIGNILILAFVLTLPAKPNIHNGPTTCMAASFFVLLGFSLVTFSLLAKMEVSFLVTSDAERFGEAVLSSIRPRLTSINSRKSVKSKQDMEEMFLKYSKKAVILVPCWALFQAVLMAIWFGLDPIQIIRFDRELKRSNSEVSVAYQHYAMACALNAKSTISVAFVALIITSHLLLFLRSFLMAFYLRKLSDNHIISDMHLVRIASYSNGVLTFVGGVIIMVFFANEPGVSQQAISILALFIVMTNTAIVFIPKIRRGLYLPSSFPTFPRA